MRPWLARASLLLNALTFGPPNTYVCARLADRFGPYSLPCRILDYFIGRDHCRKVWFWDRYQK